MKKTNNFIIENLKTIIYALIIAIFIRSFFFQPFYIPSSSMEPNLLVGDRIFVSKYSFGFSKHSFPFSPNIFKGRILGSYPKRGDIIVFKTPQDNRTDFIKRLIGLPGDKIQITNGDLYINEKKVLREKKINQQIINCGDQQIEVNFYEEALQNEIKYIAVYRKNGTMMNTNKFIVPENNLFFMGDNRDCSNDSRSLVSVGYVKFENLVGKARWIFFSNDKKKGSFFQVWKWHESIRFERFFNKIK